MIEGFIFDLDGVLTDTAEFHYLGWQRLADEEGLTFSRQINERLRGVSRRESMLIILNGRQIPEIKMQAWMDRKNRYYLEYIQTITPADLLPGALALLEEVRTAGLKAALASSSRNARLVVERLEIARLLDLIVDGDSVIHPKPAADLFLLAATGLGLQPEDCVVVEDATAGIEAARAGGFISLGLGPQERVGGADIVLPSLDGVRLADILAACLH
jgi:beta-phosphoglucomutase